MLNSAHVLLLLYLESTEGLLIRVSFRDTELKQRTVIWPLTNSLVGILMLNLLAIGCMSGGMRNQNDV